MAAQSINALAPTPGGHIGLMAGSRARTGIWPDIAACMAGRSRA